MIKDYPYIVLWRDHFSTDGWFDKEDIEVHEELLFETLGFFIKEDNNYYHFARTKGEDQYADIMSILKTQIIEINPLGRKS